MLYLVSTPIGNLGDITVRALEVLQRVDLIAAEDTRTTLKLLTKYGIGKPLVSFHEHNERRAGERLLRELRDGKEVALVTEAGTPGISDPGFTLVRSALAADLPVTMLPGPTAFVPAVLLSGLAVHSFTFRGFPPRKPGPRRRFLAVDQHAIHTQVFYESPYRLLAFLTDAIEVFGNRRAAVANDLTKLYEHVSRGTLVELLAALKEKPLRGEYCVVIEGAPPDAATSSRAATASATREAISSVTREATSSATRDRT